MASEIADAASVQAWASVAIAVLTGLLILVSAIYAGLTRRVARSTAELASETRRLANATFEQREFERTRGSREAAERLARVVEEKRRFIFSRNILSKDRGLEFLENTLQIDDVGVTECQRLAPDAVQLFMRFGRIISVAYFEWNEGRLTEEEAVTAIRETWVRFEDELGRARNGETVRFDRLPPIETAHGFLHMLRGDESATNPPKPGAAD